MGGFDTSDPIQDRSTTSTMPTMAYNAMLGRCPRGTVGAPDDDLFGQTIQPALGHTEYTPVAHFIFRMTERKMTMRLDWRALCHISITVCESGRTYALKMHPAATGGVLGRRSEANRSRVVGRQRNQLTRRTGP